MVCGHKASVSFPDLVLSGVQDVRLGGAGMAALDKEFLDPAPIPTSWGRRPRTIIERSSTSAYLERRTVAP